jgi:hypothetical protein
VDDSDRPDAHRERWPMPSAPKPRRFPVTDRAVSCRTSPAARYAESCHGAASCPSWWARLRLAARQAAVAVLARLHQSADHPSPPPVTHAATLSFVPPVSTDRSRVAIDLSSSSSWRSNSLKSASRPAGPRLGFSQAGEPKRSQSDHARFSNPRILAADMFERALPKPRAPRRVARPQCLQHRLPRRANPGRRPRDRARAAERAGTQAGSLWFPKKPCSLVTLTSPSTLHWQARRRSAARSWAQAQALGSRRLRHRAFHAQRAGAADAAAAAVELLRAGVFRTPPRRRATAPSPS